MINRKNIIKLLNKVLDHNYFKAISISIILSFLTFNGFFYVRSFFIETSSKKKSSNIKIEVGDYQKKLKKLEDQKLEYIVRPNETLSEILFNLGSNETDIANILAATKKIFDPRDIFPGQKLIFNYRTIISYKENNPSLGLIRKSIISKVSLSPDPEINMLILRKEGGLYVSEKEKKELEKRIAKYSVTINNSLFADGMDAGVSPSVMIEMINIYSFDVDFQRDIRKGDKFEILFEDYYDKEGNRVKNGNILFAHLDLNSFRNPLEVYLFKYKNIDEYFDENGKSVRKSLLRTPINGARISSGFGYRRHPVLGYKKKHRGLDFAAPRGTPILAAGSGMIERIGRYGSYGNYVRIKHNKTYSTAYAHSKGFARGLSKGSRVKQGQVVAYVGTTGRSTGPHLHYEVLKNGVRINPAKFKGTSGINLSGGKLSEFKEKVKDIDRLLDKTENSSRS